VSAHLIIIILSLFKSKTTINTQPFKSFSLSHAALYVCGNHLV